MKNYKYIGLFLLSLGVVSCDINNELEAIQDAVVPEVALNTGGLDFSSYISVGASFTAGYTDGAIFKASQENSFPNILANKFGVADSFKQPLMEDNIGGLLFGGNPIAAPRFYFNGAGPARLDAMPTTEGTTVLSGPFNNYGVPGAKSFHLVAPEYGALAGVPALKANPYYARMASSQTATVLGDALAQSPTFFTLSEIGGNDVLAFAASGGFNPAIEESDFTEAKPASNAIYQSDNTVSPADYSGNDITNTDVFASVFSNMVAALTANGAKGVVANVPYITSLPYFTTVPYNAVPMDAATAAGVSAAYAPYNAGIQGAFAWLVANTPMTQEMADAEIAKRTIEFAAGQNAVVIMDENLTDLTAINPALVSMRQTTSEDLILLTSSGVLGELADPSNPASVNGVGVPLADMFVLTADEKEAVKTATDAYNTTIAAVAAANENITMVDFKALLEEASTTGVVFDDYTLTTSLVTGGLVSLDGVHLNARGYALMANEILAAMDVEFGTNFTEATNGLAKADDYPTNYSPSLQ